MSYYTVSLQNYKNEISENVFAVLRALQFMVKLVRVALCRKS